MAKIVSVKAKKREGALVVTVEDADGEQAVHTIHVFNKDRCPTCGRQNTLDLTGSVDVQAIMTAISGDADAYRIRWQQILAYLANKGITVS